MEGWHGLERSDSVGPIDAGAVRVGDIGEGRWSIGEGRNDEVCRCRPRVGCVGCQRGRASDWKDQRVQTGCFLKAIIRGVFPPTFGWNIQYD